MSEEGNETTEGEARRPHLRVVRGRPDDHELAALTVALSGAGAREEPGPARGGWSRWADPAARLRRPLRPGPGAWRASARPQ
ncbi:acyl-CoA carboxylase subunit epsilon [Haloechinothrix sp. YIM 98757]|uniref:Acyl-CoA carboxylase subunit epsilon n=1 Tax=Haloechinothrix aidingensis TaxID=2752311 RepID=A0A838AFR6_9PSEU|nr:acyl-CoA carboxylase subunit epsilon [Haloechinothrix aidingensis]MBA0128051.1 acyl-CoA carboxylase subunit epsilon [Haloechinothrix aidingensis]